MDGNFSEQTKRTWPKLAVCGSSVGLFELKNAGERYISTWSTCFQISRVFVPEGWIVPALLAQHTLHCMQSFFAGVNLHVCCVGLYVCEHVMCTQLRYRIMRDAGQALA